MTMTSGDRVRSAVASRPEIGNQDVTDLLESHGQPENSIIRKAALAYGDLLEILENRQKWIEAGQREGQAWFNACMEQYPKEVSRLIETDVDPFHDDTKITAFLLAVFGD